IIKVSNTVSNNGSWFTDNSNNTVEYTGTSQNITLPAGAPNYHNLVLSGNDTINFPNSALCIDGDLIIGSNITTNINQNLTVKGDFTNNSPNFTNNAGTITFNGTKNQSINGTGTTIFKKLTIDNTGYTVSAGSSFGVLDTLKLNSGSVLDMESQSLTAVGTISGSGTLTTQNTGTSPLPADKTWSCNVIYNNQTAAQSVAAGTYNNLKISNPIGANASGTINATTLTIDSRAILHMGTNILNSITTNNGTGTLTTQNTGSTPIPTGKTWTSQVVYNGSEAQTAVKGTFNSLIIDNATGVSVANNDSISVKGYLFINNSKKLVIPTNTVMNAQTISNNAGASGITIKSDSTAANGSLIFHNSAGSPVSATVEMFSKAFALDYNPTTKTYSNYKWEFFGVPLQSIVPFPIFNGSYIRKHSESGTSSATHWLTVSNSTVLTPVDGYEITQPIAKTITFQGQLVNSDYTKTLPYTPGSTFIGQSVLSNPYTAAIDIAQLNFGNGTDATVYIYNTGSIGDWSKSSDENSAGQYLAIPKGVAALRMEGFQWKIPSMQGFLVKTTSTSTLGIPYSAVISKNTDRQKVRSSSSSSSNVYTKIDVAGTRYSDKMWIITNPTCSHGFDNGWDGTKFLGSSLAPQIWAMETAGDYQVNGVDNINNTSLAFKSGENTTYTLTFTHESSTSAYPSLYLVDLLDNHITDITASGSQYTFNSNQTSTPTTARFKIVTNFGITTEEGQLSNSLNVFNSMNTIYVNNNSSLKGEVIICDITGRYIQKYPFNPNGLTTIATDLTTGVYLMRATTSENENIQKVIIK
ncbi:MAG TPA: T9SS type A sorting domain-containing protein, partial [Paludibacter sp.]